MWLFFCGDIDFLRLLMRLLSWGRNLLGIIIKIYCVLFFLDILLWTILFIYLSILRNIIVSLAYENLHIHGEASILKAQSLLAVTILQDFLLN